MKAARWTVWAALAAGVVTGVGAIDVDAAIAPGATVTATATGLRLWSECVSLANTARAGVGLGPLHIDLRVANAAAGQSTYQAQQQTMTHAGPGGNNAGSRLQAQGYTWNTWGENVAAGQGDCKSVMSAWLASPGHRANILNGSFVHIGIGNVVGVNGVHYWTMDLAAGS